MTTTAQRHEVGDREIDFLIAEHLFGWRWVSYIGTPVKGTPDYPKNTRVRRFFPPETLRKKEWMAYLAKNEVADAKGDEPLEYAYCSSMPPAIVPSYAGEADVSVLRFVRSRWMKKSKKKWAAFCEALPECWDYTPGDFSRAALTVLGLLE